ncbi:DinB family protein [Rhizobium halophytocola]|uniref:Damage-inducible protein DinB n=1 Tax=Rhizobium halophytocola TaxID=735519 RepID=A0ABS4E3R0_9HYPH|nr:DinB family protein [Rhizobium halophytocola]MBP1852544.1 putative damage-inducible protein DinB [Rhizobium halophytocola]
MSTQSLFNALFAQKASIEDELLYAIEAIAELSSPGLLNPVLERLGHINTVDRIFQAHLSGTQQTPKSNWPEKTLPLPDIARHIRKTDQWYIDHVAALAPETFEEEIAFTFADGKKGRMTREEMLAHVVTHSGYHRGEVGVLLPHVGAVGRRDILSGFLHRVEPERRA